MAIVLLVSEQTSGFLDLKKIFENNNDEAQIVSTGETALNTLKKLKADVVIVNETLPDMTGKQFVNELVMVNPMLNCVVASDLPKEEFHDAYEGLGILMQFPAAPGETDVKNLMAHIEKIAGIAKGLK